MSRGWSRAMQDTPMLEPLALGHVRGVPWAYVLGEGDDPDAVLFRHQGCCMALDVPEAMGWPRNKDEALSMGLRVLQHGYFHPRPLAGVTLTPRPDPRAINLGE